MTDTCTCYGDGTCLRCLEAETAPIGPDWRFERNGPFLIQSQARTIYAGWVVDENFHGLADLEEKIRLVEAGLDLADPEWLAVAKEFAEEQKR